MQASLNIFPKPNGGGIEIRTLEELTPLTVFKTAAFDRSAIPPYMHKAWEI